MVSKSCFDLGLGERCCVMKQLREIEDRQMDHLGAFERALRTMKGWNVVDWSSESGKPFDDMESKCLMGCIS